MVWPPLPDPPYPEAFTWRSRLRPTAFQARLLSLGSLLGPDAFPDAALAGFCP